MSAAQQADEINAGKNQYGRQRADYRVEEGMPLVRYAERHLYMAGVWENDVLAS